MLDGSKKPSPQQATNTHLSKDYIGRWLFLSFGGAKKMVLLWHGYWNQRNKIGLYIHNELKFTQ